MIVNKVRYYLICTKLIANLIQSIIDLNVCILINYWLIRRIIVLTYNFLICIFFFGPFNACFIEEKSVIIFYKNDSNDKNDLLLVVYWRKSCNIMYLLLSFNAISLNNRNVNDPNIDSDSSIFLYWILTNNIIISIIKNVYKIIAYRVTQVYVYSFVLKYICILIHV